MNKIFQIKKESTVQIEIKKSKFFCFSFVVENKLQIENILNDMNKKYCDATHICYAYVCHFQEKACDNGEPQGTAGKPILDCIKHKNLQNVLVVVVRYFGGVKLGAGGLVRAYSGCAKTVLEQSEISECAMCKKLTFEVEFSLQKSLQKLLNNPIILKSKVVYGDKIFVELYFMPEEVDATKKLVSDCFLQKIKMQVSDDLFVVEVQSNVKF